VKATERTFSGADPHAAIEVSDQLVTAAQLTELVKNLSTLVTRDKSSANSKAISVSTDNGKIAVFLYTIKGPGGSRSTSRRRSAKRTDAGR
jgi:hypothetical protein